MVLEEKQSRRGEQEGHESPTVGLHNRTQGPQEIEVPLGVTFWGTTTVPNVKAKNIMLRTDHRYSWKQQAVGLVL